MAIRDLRAVGLGELLGSLLTAVVEGQAAATASSLAFVKGIGLEEAAEQPDRLRTVPIRYTKLDENQQPAEFVLDLPLLALVNIPTLNVKQATISFKYDVLTTTVTDEGTPTADAAGPATLGTPMTELRPVKLVGYVRSAPTGGGSSQTRETTGVDVQVTVESVPLPLGLERILDMAELVASRPAPKADA
jgi:hypothetical protein